MLLPNQSQRVIAHVDLDAFYTQVEVQRNPQLKGLPVVTVQYNPFGDLRTITPDEPRIFNDSNGSSIAVSYEARASGVKRGMRGDQARKVCPEVQLVQVPTAHGKADLTLYRDAGKQVVDILSRIGIVERASIDECYIDLTEESRARLAACNGQPPLPVNPDRVHVCGQGDDAVGAWWERAPEQWHSGELLLACGATAVADLRAAVAAELSYSCSAGIAHNKILAKLASGMHKPSQQTLVPMPAIPGLLQDLPIPKLRQLGGKFGDELMASLNIKTVGELAGVSLPVLSSQFGDSTAQWLYGLARGCDTEEVKQRTLPKSISCGKTFRNHTALGTIGEVQHWLFKLGEELEERVVEDRKANARLPQLLTVNFYMPPEGLGKGQAGNGPGQGKGQDWQGGTSISRSCHLRKATADCMAHDATLLVKKWTATQKSWSLWSMFMAVSNFTAAPTGGSLITRFFKQPSSIGQATQPQQPSAQEDQLLPSPRLPGNALISEGRAGSVLTTGRSDPRMSTEQGQDVASISRQLEHSATSTGADEQSPSDTSPARACPSKALTPEPVIGLRCNAPTGMPLTATVPLSAFGINNRAQQSQEIVSQKQPSDVLHATPGLASTQRPIQLGRNSLQPSLSSPAPAMPDDHEQNLHGDQHSSAVVAAGRADLSGASDHPVDTKAAHSDSMRSCTQAHGPAQQGAAKRPLEPAFAKEPEHRKKPSRAQHSGVDAPLLVNFAEGSIDEAVLSELPASMQREIRLSMMSQKPASKHSQPGSVSKHRSAGMRKFLKPRT